MNIEVAEYSLIVFNYYRKMTTTMVKPHAIFSVFFMMYSTRENYKYVVLAFLM